MLHNDYRVKWKNYRPFTDTGWIVIKPLTIVIGANNAGKSSLVSPLLLLNQTIASRDAITPLITRGPLLDAGTFRDILYRHDDQRELSFALEYHTHSSSKNMKALGAHPPGGLEVNFGSDGKDNDIALNSFKVIDVFRRPYLSKLRSKSGKYKTIGYATAAKMTAREAKAVREHTPTNFLFSTSSVIYDLQPSSAEMESDAPFSSDFSEYVRIMSYTYERIAGLLHSLSYIGPLRERPRRHYEYAGDIPPTVGPRGENTASILRRLGDELSEDLNRWVKKFGFGDRLEIARFGSDIFSIEFETDGYRTNLADAGFGASQLLPLIVQSLVAPTGSLTIAEQPEIHLNPRLQSVLADLLVEMAIRDHRIVVETHSEHLLLSVRKLIAQGKIDASKVAVYFVEKEDKQSQIRHIRLSENGTIQDDQWPKGFFADALTESLALARAQLDRVKDAV